MIPFSIRIILLNIIMLSTGLVGTAHDESSDEQISFHEYVELGNVHWHRNLDRAKSLARSSGKPIFLLFQEVPGCQTCQNYGNQPLSHPLLVEAIEDLFVPVAVFNNQRGADAEILGRFKEPAWNNPVVRFINEEENDIIPRQDRVWSLDGTVNRMLAALKSAGKQVPAYVRLISATPDRRDIQTAEFAMHCYWEGEARLGGIRGVVSTRAGWRDNLEVVQVQFLPAVIDYETLLKTAQSFKCASRVYAHDDQQFRIAQSIASDQARRATGAMRDAKAADQKYYLNRTAYRHLPLTEFQATLINAAIAERKSFDQLLSPRQQAIARRIQSVVSVDAQALREFEFPVDQNRLAEYQQTLLEKLQQISPSG